jgi:translocation and assembly module TamA
MKKYLLLLICCNFCILSPAIAKEVPHLKFEVRGVVGPVQQNVVSRLAIESRELDNHFSATAVENFAQQSVTAVRDAIAPFGYYRPEVSAIPRREGDGWIVIYNIHPGRPVLIKSVNINIIGAGADNAKIQRLIKRFPLKTGDIFNSVIYTTARDKLFDAINNQGYIKAIARESKILVDPDKFTAAIVLTLNTNERYYFGDLKFNNNVYDPKFMQRFNRFQRDEPFSSNKLLQYQQDMNNSRYFKQVIVIPDLEGGKDYHVPMQASIVPINSRRYAFGLGWGSFTKARLTAGVNLKRLTDTGQALDAQLKLSSVLSGVGLKYYIPGFNPLTEQWIIGANYQKFIPKNGNSHSKSLSFGYSRKLNHWQLASNMNYLWERYRVEKIPNRDSQLFYPNITLNYLKTDNVVQPTYGRSLNMVLQGASNTVLSSTSFLQGVIKGKLFMTPFSFAHIILRGDIGYTVVHELTELPLSMRFFAGGLTTIRGFPDSSIGPGKYLGVASIEYRNHIAYDFSGAVFYDIGTATNHFGEPLSRGAGVGLVYESVVGPIKLYVSRGLSKKRRPYQIEFSMGPEF